MVLLQLLKSLIENESSHEYDYGSEVQCGI